MDFIFDDPRILVRNTFIHVEDGSPNWKLERRLRSKTLPAASAYLPNLDDLQEIDTQLNSTMLEQYSFTSIAASGNSFDKRTDTSLEESDDPDFPRTASLPDESNALCPAFADLEHGTTNAVNEHQLLAGYPNLRIRNTFIDADECSPTIKSLRRRPFSKTLPPHAIDLIDDDDTDSRNCSTTFDTNGNLTRHVNAACNDCLLQRWSHVTAASTSAQKANTEMETRHVSSRSGSQRIGIP